MQNISSLKDSVKIEDALPYVSEKKTSEKPKVRYSTFQKFISSTLFSILLSTILFGSLFGTAFYIAYKTINKPQIPQNYEECIKSKGSYIKETYPAICVSKDNKEFIEPLSDDEKKLLESEINNN